MSLPYLRLRLESILIEVYRWLGDAAHSDSFIELLTQAFGTTFNQGRAEYLRQQWSQGYFNELPVILIRSQSELKTANAAYAAETNAIYLSDQFLEYSSQEQLVATLLEEVGHFVDAEINAVDTPGDEGELFSARLRGEYLSSDAIQAITVENDSAAFVIDGESIAVEQAQVSDSGGFEGSREILKLDAKGGGKAIVSYEFYTIPDQIILRYEGKNILDTGFIPGNSKIEVDIPQGNSDELEVILATNDEDTRWNYTVSNKNTAYLLFREGVDGSWKIFDQLGGLADEVPGWDHVGFSYNDRVYESHPGYVSGNYYDPLTQKQQPVLQEDGVQKVHTRGSFLHDSTDVSSSAAYRTASIPIPADVAEKMVAQIDPSQLPKEFLYLDYANLLTSLSSSAQKGSAGTYTCVGLVEWAAERAGYNGGQGFIPNALESFTVAGKTIPLLSPELLAYAVGAPINQFQTIANIGTRLGELGVSWFGNEVQQAESWLKGLLSRGVSYLQGFFDPVDFILTDPLGRRLGHTAATGMLNEIPGALYTGDGKIEQFLILDSIPGEYRVQLFGTNENALAAIGGPSTTGRLFEGRLAEGQTQSLTVTVPQRTGSSRGIADLAVSRTDQSGTVGLAQQYTYTLNVTNNGADTATGVVLTEALPSGVALVSGTANGQPVRTSNSIITANLGTLSRGSTTTVNLTVQPLASGTLTSRTTVTSNQVDSNLTNNLLASPKAINSTVPSATDLELTQTVSNATPNLGSQVSLTLTLTNKGPGTASSVRVKDLLPAGLSFVSARTVQGSYSSQTGIWNAGNFRSGLTRTLTITARVTGLGRIDNSAEITSASELDPDSTPGNNAPNEDDRTTVSLIGIPTDDVFGIAPSPINFKKGKRGISRNGSKRNDALQGSNQKDILQGSRGNDRVLGQGGKDRLNGGDGNDKLSGGSDRDQLNGDAGRDHLLGQSGADVLIGGSGGDKLTGGSGQDLFVFGGIADGGDLITDFTSTDLIDLRIIFSSPDFRGTSKFLRFTQFVQIVQVGTGTEVRLDADGVGSGITFAKLATLNNTPANTITTRNFVIS